MGAGKTQSAVTLMNQDKENKYIYITPYLDEVERIKKSCTERRFTAPENRGMGKLDSLHALIAQDRNIASTHALFSMYTQETADLIRNAGYTLILDEVFCVVDPVEIKSQDLKMLLDDKKMEVEEDGEHVRWLDEKYDGRFLDIKDKADSHTLILYKGKLLFWSFPMDIFKAFDKVIILTYMFSAQNQKYYFDMSGVDIEYIGTKKVGSSYQFCSVTDSVRTIPGLRNRIHVCMDESLNMIGEKQFSLSSSWYDRESKHTGKPWLVVLRKNLSNYFKNKAKAHSSDIMWTTFMKHQSSLQNKGYTKSFVSCNIRATNEYRNRTCAAYCINVYNMPMLKGYFEEHGCMVEEDRYALSEMVQWIWRSAIRDGKEINVYVPSQRMRDLLLNWIDEVS